MLLKLNKKTKEWSFFMKKEYEELYKQLVDAYYHNHFEEVFAMIMKEKFESKEEAREILAILCGVEDEKERDDYSFLQAVVHSIVTHQVRSKIMNKIHICDTNCEVVEGKAKCQRVCPVDAILNTPMGNDKWLDETKCIHCGRCIPVCDNHNFMDTPQFLPLAGLLKETEVYAIVAPAIAGQFGKNVTLDMLREAFVRIGFSEMIEVALAADILSLKEALEFNNHIKKEGDFMITSCCCPVWVALMKKVYHKLIPDFSPSVSPMIAMGRIIKKFHPQAKVVFIGPCVAKKAEAKEPDLKGTIDYVLTFQELNIIFEALDIDPTVQKGLPSVDYASTGGRLYARTGGVSQAVYDIVDQLFLEKRKLFQAIHVDGVKECRELLTELETGKVGASFIEGMGCVGGCVGGPKAIIKKEEGRIAVDEVAYDSAIKIPVNSEVLTKILDVLEISDINELMEKGSMFERTFE